MTNSNSTDALVPKGVARFSVPRVASTQNVVFVLVPKFSMVAFSSAIETLRIANQLTGQTLYCWSVLSEDGAPVRASNGVQVSVDSAIGQTPREAIIFACSGVEPRKMTGQVIPNWIREQWRLGRTVGGLCTGAYTLAKAGILQDACFTLHWENLAAFEELYPHLHPAKQLYAIDNKILTCAGGAASMDLFAHLILETYGAQLARNVLNMCMVPYHRNGDEDQLATNALQIGIRNARLTEILTYFEDNIEEIVSLEELSRQVGVSRRQIERLFRKHTGMSPRKYLTNMRLHRGRALLAETDTSVTEVAVACGFRSATHFSKLYRQEFGHSPYRFMV